MANKYANLVGTNKIKDEYTKINTGFDRVEADINKLETDVTAVNTRVDTIITTPISGQAATQEIVDARVSAVKSKTFATLDARFEETEQDIATHKADYAAHGGIYHKNLLHNWDWRKPVNQRGLTSYSNVMYTIDRWLWTVAVSTRSVTIQSGYVTIANASGATGIFAQKMEALEPGTYTLSVQFSDNTVESKTLTWDGSTLTEQATSFGALSLRLVDGFPTFAIGIGAGKSINVQALKLEKGNVSTLANDPNADYGAELILCQRYYQLHTTNTVADMDLRPSMRITPTKTAITGGYAYSADL